MYKSVLTRLLVALADEDENELATGPTNGLLAVHEDRLKVWPPWPWPPWDPEDPDDPDSPHPPPDRPHPPDGPDRPDYPDHPGEPHEPHKPINRTEQAYKLAGKIVEFERKIANASLDLYAAYFALR